MIYPTPYAETIDDGVWYDACVCKHQPPFDAKLECDIYVLKAFKVEVAGGDTYGCCYNLAFAETKEELLVYANLHGLEVKQQLG